MKNIKLIIIGIFPLLFLSSCLEDYQELNTNPELLGSTDPRNAFTGATQNFNNSSRGHLMNKYSDVMQYMQYIVNYQGPQESIYVNLSKTSRPAPYTPYYNDYFGQIGLKLRYLINNVIPLNPEKERFQNVAAIAKILEAYEAWLVFDVNGAAPYNEAFKLATDGIKTPKYDLYQADLSGKKLYEVFDQKLKTNIEVLKKKLPDQYNLGSNDYFYSGDVSKWIKFANTVRIKMAQRLEKVDNEFYKSILSDVLSKGNELISSNSESCIYNHPNKYNNNTDDTHILTYQYCASRSLVSFLLAYDDPRLPLLIRRNGFGEGNNNKENDKVAKLLKKHYPDYKTKFSQWAGRYVGMSANPDSTNSNWSKDTYYSLAYKDENGTDKTMTVRHNSQIESRFYVKNGGKVGTQITARDKEDETFDISQDKISLFTPLITYPEVCFMMAEITYKNGTSQGGKDALTWFRDGIRASMEQYQTWAEKMKIPSAMNPNSDNYSPITSDKIDKYLAKTEFKTVSLEKIISQQWVNLYMRPEEAWATWKRTNLPAFKEQPTPQNGVAYLEILTSSEGQLLIPRRAALPIPNSANLSNYNKALEKLKKDPKYGSDVDKTEGRIWWDK